MPVLKRHTRFPNSSSSSRALGALNSFTGAVFLSQRPFHGATISADTIIASKNKGTRHGVNPSSGNLRPADFHLPKRAVG